jgi:hypothetical protein
MIKSNQKITTCNTTYLKIATWFSVKKSTHIIKNETPQYFNDQCVMGSLAMTSFVLG